MSVAQVTTPGTTPGTAPGTAPMTGWVMPPGTPDAGTGDAVEWVTVTTAMTRRSVSRRTVRRWIAAGIVESRLVEEDGRQVRLIRGDTLPTGTDDDTGDVRSAGIGDDTRDSSGDSHRDVTDDVTGGSSGTGDSSLERLVTAQAQEIQQLRAQLEHRAQEIQRRDQAEAELRRLLLSSQQGLQMALERPMLPPAPDTQAKTPKRARWWNLLWR
jgi:hypothetical protein